MSTPSFSKKARAFAISEPFVATTPCPDAAVCVAAFPASDAVSDADDFTGAPSAVAAAAAAALAAACAPALAAFLGGRLRGAGLSCRVAEEAADEAAAAAAEVELGAPPARFSTQALKGEPFAGVFFCRGQRQLLSAHGLPTHTGGGSSKRGKGEDIATVQPEAPTGAAPETAGAAVGASVEVAVLATAAGATSAVVAALPVAAIGGGKRDSSVSLAVIAAAAAVAAPVAEAIIASPARAAGWTASQPAGAPEAAISGLVDGK